MNEIEIVLDDDDRYVLPKPVKRLEEFQRQCGRELSRMDARADAAAPASILRQLLATIFSPPVFA